MTDFGYVTVMPELDDIKTTPEARRLPFTHADEKTTPYYYSVSMDAGASRTIKTEITATDHCAIMEFTYPQSAHASLLVEATRPGVDGDAEVDPVSQEITGYNPDWMDAPFTTLKMPSFKGYFVVQFSKPFSGFGTYQGSSVTSGVSSATGKNVGAYATFNTSQNEKVMMRIGTSYISVEQARENLKEEIPNWNFDGIKTHLRSIWNQKLSQVSLQGGTSDDVTEFYTGMFHAMIYPRLFSEHGRYYSAFDDKIHNGVSYTAYSIWDIFRAEFGFITLFCPERVNDMVQALLQDYQEGGWMPKWPDPCYTSIMISTHADSLVAEAINKGFHGFDYNLAYQAAYQDAMTPPNGDTTHRWGDRSRGMPYTAREGLTYYKQLGYVPCDKTDRASSCTMEGAYDDWCVGQVAKADGRFYEYKLFTDRSKNYRNVFNPATGQMEGRKSDGSWAGTSGDFFTEGGNLQNSFSVWQDIPGLIKLMGGTDSFNRALDKSNPDLTNEPGEHFPYLYDYSGLPSKTQSMVRGGLSDGYNNTPSGLPGNDDCGQISAWWMFSAIGFYPVNPASGVYMIGSPLFDRVALHLPNGRTFTVTAANNSSSNIYVQSVTLNGMPLNVPYITWAQIQAGGTLGFVMGPQPSQWGADWRGTPL
jgi:predicted alpha-1,2-mannosidase